MRPSKPDSSLSDAVRLRGYRYLSHLSGGAPRLGSWALSDPLYIQYISVECRCASHLTGVKWTFCKHSFTDPAGGHCWKTQHSLKWGYAKCQLPNAQKNEVLEWTQQRCAQTGSNTHTRTSARNISSAQKQVMTRQLCNHLPKFCPPPKKKMDCICNPHTVGWTILRYLICSFPELRLNLINLKSWQWRQRAAPLSLTGQTAVDVVHNYLPKVSSLRGHLATDDWNTVLNSLGA